MSLFTAYDSQYEAVKAIMLPQLQNVLNPFGKALKDLNLDFSHFQDKTVPALITVDLMKELTAEDKSFFIMTGIADKIKKQIARAISINGLTDEETGLVKSIKEDLNSSFDQKYYSNEVGIHWSKDNTFAGYICDDSLGSPLTKWTSLQKAHEQFARYAMCSPSEVKLKPIVPSLSSLEATPNKDYWINQISKANESKSNPYMEELLIEAGVLKGNTQEAPVSTPAPIQNSLTEIEQDVGVPLVTAGKAISTDFRNRD